jgi:hypothetical protein
VVFLGWILKFKKNKDGYSTFFLIIVGVALKGNSEIRMLLRCERDQTGN